VILIYRSATACATSHLVTRDAQRARLNKGVATGTRFSRLAPQLNLPNRCLQLSPKQTNSTFNPQLANYDNDNWNRNPANNIPSTTATSRAFSASCLFSLTNQAHFRSAIFIRTLLDVRGPSFDVSPRHVNRRTGPGFGRPEAIPRRFPQPRVLRGSRLQGLRTHSSGPFVERQ
jgi:hypothetical protein